MELYQSKLLSFRIFDIFNPSIADGSFKLTSFRETFTKTCLGMLLNGVYPGHQRVVSSIWLITNYLLQTTAISILLYTAVFDLKNGHYSDATRQLSIFFLLVNMLIKMTNLWYHRKRTASLIDRLNYDYKKANNEFNEVEQNIIKKYVISGIFVQNVWCLMVGFVGSIFPVSAILIMTHSAFFDTVVTKRMAFYCLLPWLDEIKYDTPLFQLFFVYELFLSISCSLLYMGFDPLIPIFSLHICGQLELVNERLKKVFRKNIDILETRQRISAIVEHLQEIYRYSEDVNTVSTSVYEAIFSSTPFLSTAAAFQTFSCLKTGQLPYEFAFFFIATVVHIFIPSYYGDLLLEKSLSVCQAVYDCNWECHADKSACRTLSIVMLRAQRPLQLSTMFKPVSLMLFSEVCQQSWTIFNLLTAVFK
uniref:Odorant receptor n=1 Tax=Rhyacophila nubila TaxID=1876001 RepID=A0A3G2KX42_9NEOP|nr:odorant receptor OR5 [Rhyacophila nubila]